MLKAPILSYLLRHTAYLYVGIVCIGSFSLIDLYFVAQLGLDELTALSFASPVVLWVLSFLLGIGTGITTIVARHAAGSGPDRLRSAIRTAGKLSLVMGVLLVVLGYSLHRSLFDVLQAEVRLRSLIADYLFILYPGFIVLALLIGILSVERALGRNRSITVVLAVVVALNLLLDPVLIFGWIGFPELGLKGAASASVIALAFGLGMALYIRQKSSRIDILDSESPLTDSHHDSGHSPTPEKKDWLEMIYIGIPVALTNAVFPVAVGFITGFLSIYGSDAVAAYGVANRVDLLAMLFITALSATLAPFVTQNWTVGRKDRIEHGLRLSMGLALVYSSIVLMILMSTRTMLAELFTNQDRVIAHLDLYYRIVPWGYFPAAVAILASSTLIAIGYPIHASVLNLIHLLVLYVPLAYGLAGLYQVGGIFTAYPVAGVLAAVIGFFLLRSRL